ncbi:hypothetical protein L3Q82_018882 [Scortum barcoo]|uniref:Uncharacterized protein n=1 Tax=Scortum barcoo TaxID=214431 RepID=A0ACB8VFX7_9TELE|nr:hypothetical protein L3Q82_018882 [Scortum barcoo]
MLACGTPDAVDGQVPAGQASHSPELVLEAKTRVWEEFGEAMEEDYRSALKKFWQTVLAPQKGEADGGRNTFEDLLNPTDTPSNEEAEAGDSEVDLSITKATEVVRKLLCGRVLGVDEIRPEYLKSLDVVGKSWRRSWRKCLG